MKLLKSNDFLLKVIIGIFFAFPILPTAVQSISQALLIFVIVFLSLFDLSLLKSIFKIDSIFYIGYFLIAILSYFWSTDQSMFFKEVSSNFVLLFTPFIIHFNKRFKEKEIDIFKWIFIVASIFLSLKIIIYCSYGFMWHEHYFGRTDLYYMSFFNRIIHAIPYGYDVIYNCAQLSCPNKNGILHKNYSSTIYFFSILFLFSFLIKGIQNKLLKVLVFILIGFFIVNIFYYKSLINIFLVICLPILYLLRKKSFFFIVNVLLVFTFSFICFVYFNQNEFVAFIIKYDIERYIIYPACIKIIQNNFLFGVGLGDEFELINSTTKMLRNVYNIGERNSHSQFFYYFLAGGIFNFIFFILHFIKIYSKSIKFYIIFLLLIIISNCLFENFICRFIGVELYLLLILLISLEASNLDKKNIE